MKLKRAKGVCIFCGSAAKHTPRIKRTSPDGGSAVIVACHVRGKDHEWKANEQEGKLPVNGVRIEPLMATGVFSPVDGPSHSDHAAALAHVAKMKRRKHASKT